MAWFYSTGGIYMHPIALWLVVAAIALFVEVARKRDLSRVVWGALGLAVATGLLGTLVGFVEMFSALVETPVEKKPDLLYIGLSIAFNPLVFGLGGAVLLAHAALPIALWLRRRVSTAEA